jgi:hypothetical protein
MRRSTVLLPILLPVLCLWAADPARAAPRLSQVVVLETRTSGDVRTEDRARIGDALWAALDRLGLRRVPDSDREAVLSGEVGLRGCLDRDECLERLGRLLEATHVIGIALSRTAPTAYKAEIRVFDVDVGLHAAQLDWSCTACSLEDVARKIDSLVEGAVQKDHARPRATLVIRSVPPNADVKIDGKSVGATEVERRVFAGVHDILVQNPRLSLHPEQMRVEVAGEQRLHLLFSLGERVRVAEPAERPPEPVPVQPAPAPTIEKPPPPRIERRSRWKLGLGVPLFLVGLAGAGLGAASLALDGRCADEPACGKVFDTRLPGIIEASVGGALLVTGVVLLAADGAEQRRLKVSLAPVLAPQAAGLAWTYHF